MTNPYQRIPGKQKGHIDTRRKFDEMVQDINLKGLDVLDVGCNLGEMTRLAAAMGAHARGIDKTPEFIEQALELTPYAGVSKTAPTFAIEDGYEATGTYDLAIVSAAFHYFADWSRLLRRLSRVAKRVRVDVWIHEGDRMHAALTHRKMLVPSREMFVEFASQHFEDVEEVGPVISPDISKRILYDLKNPERRPWKALVVYGPGGTGKTTLGRRLARQGYEHLQLDSLFLSWRRNFDRAGWSVEQQTKSLKGERWGDYLDDQRKRVRKWLLARRGDDVVIEGYSAADPFYREMVTEELHDLGWGRVEKVDKS